MRFHEERDMERDFETQALRAYPDAKSHRDQYLSAAAKKFTEGLESNGLTPNETITRVFLSRTMREAREDYENQRDATLLHNLKVIDAGSERRMKEIKRRGTWQALFICPPISLIFGVLAWFNFSRQHDVATGITCAAGSLAFLVILLVKYLFDR